MTAATPVVMDVEQRAALPYPRSLPEFQRLFPDDPACAAYLEKARWESGFVCPRCDANGEPFRIVSVITLFHGLVRRFFDGLSGGWADHAPTRSSMPSCSRPSIGIGGSLAAPPLPHHRTYGSVYGGSAD